MFLVPVQVNRDPAATQALKRLAEPFILRRLTTDQSVIADLPDKMEIKVFCPRTREQASLYTAVVREIEAVDRTEGIERKGLILAALSKLKQVCNHPAYFLKDNSAMPVPKGAVPLGEEPHPPADAPRLVLPADPDAFWQGQGIPDMPDPVDGGSALNILCVFFEHGVTRPGQRCILWFCSGEVEGNDHWCLGA